MSTTDTETITDARRDRLEDYDVTPMCLADYEGRYAVIENEGSTRPWSHGYDTLADAVRVAHELMEQGQPTRLIADLDTGKEWPARVTLTFPTIEPDAGASIASGLDSLAAAIEGGVTA